MIEPRSAWDIAREMGEAFDPETGEVDVDRWDALAMALGDKAEAIHAVIQRKAGEATQCDAEVDRLRQRSASLRKESERMRSYLLACMEAANVGRVKTATITASIRQGADHVDIYDITKLPKDCFCEPPPPKPNKKIIMARIKAGEKCQGACIVRGAPTVTFR